MAKPRRHDPTTIDVRAESFSIIEAAAGEGQPKIPRFDMLAYTGGPLRLGNFTNPVVADLAGMKIPSQSRPVRLQHDANMGVGHTDMIANDGRCLKASGIVSRSTPAAADVVASGLNGFPWQASMGCSIEAKEYLAPGATAFVNGQTISGPCIIARQTTLRELTICDAGADDQTSVNIAASAAQTTKEFIMDPNFQEWLQAKGFNPDLLADVGVSTLEAAWEAEIKAAQVETPDPKTIQATSPVADIRAESAAESLRISAVRKACGGKHGEIEAKAIARRQPFARRHGDRGGHPSRHCRAAIDHRGGLQAGNPRSCISASRNRPPWPDSGVLRYGRPRSTGGMGTRRRSHQGGIFHGQLAGDSVGGHE
jgi:hypothetical protein